MTVFIIYDGTSYSGCLPLSFYYELKEITLCFQSIFAQQTDVSRLQFFSNLCIFIADFYIGVFHQTASQSTIKNLNLKMAFALHTLSHPLTWPRLLLTCLQHSSSIAETSANGCLRFSNRRGVYPVVKTSSS